MPPAYRKYLGHRHWAGLVLLALSIVGCGGPASTPDTGERYAVSIPPLKAILQPLVGEGVSIHVLLPPGASPHTYEPRPSDAAAAWNATALFYVDESLDGWAADLQSRDRVALLPLLPESLRIPYAGCGHPAGEHDHDHDHDHDHGPVDPHFWVDPVAVAGIVEPLVAELARLNPARAEDYRERAGRFLDELRQLDTALKSELAPAKGQQVAVFHHAFDYLLHRHGIGVAAAIEPSPGQSAGPRTTHLLAKELKDRGARAIFIEPQLSPQSAKAVAEEASLPLITVDPLGGVPGRETYAELALWNARAIRSAFD